ncbi:hypothetical protein AMS68_002289 [Peltaster fructicola]|uniref:Cupin type-1 domain-containing protein n=1 Tax=Peltaster fructicola TaxID=286661 RepID=A0A6H0XPT1_9PEZI|nr:hypothetical protein AMS68_002289 [Peltaster fructicola]
MLVRSLALIAILPYISALPHGSDTTRHEERADNQTIYYYTNTSSLTRQNPTYTKDQLNAIKLAYTSNDRLSLIRSFGDTDDYFKYDFSPTLSGGNAGSGEGGQGLLAQVSNFPVLMGTGLSLAMGFLGPCGLDSMHIHNRATELVLLIKGGPLQTSFVMEDGLTDPFNATIGLYQAVIRPMGSIHWEFNDNCQAAVFVTALSNEDPGVSRTAQNFFVNPIDLVEGAMGYPAFLDNQTTEGIYRTLPRAFALGAKECLKRCGVTYTPEDNPNYSTNTTKRDAVEE